MDNRSFKLGILIIAIFAGIYILLSYVTSQNKEKNPIPVQSETPVSSKPRDSDLDPVFRNNSGSAQSSAPLKSSTEKRVSPTDQKPNIKKESNPAPDEAPLSELEKKYGKLSAEDILRLLASNLSDIDRNYLEHLLAQSQDQDMDETLHEMIDDGFIDLSLESEDLSEEGGAEFMDAAVRRMNSAIRVAGLRGQTSTVPNIIEIASHYNADESTVRTCYEALGYLSTKAGQDFLSAQLKEQQNPFLKSEIILSLSTTGNRDNIKLYLSYLKSRDTDLRNSAIVALGDAREEQAVEPFADIFNSTDHSSKVLIVQALNKIDSAPSRDLLEQIAKTHPQLITPVTEGD